MYIYMYAYIHMYTSIYIYVHIHIYSYTCIYIYIYIYGVWILNYTFAPVFLQQTWAGCQQGGGKEREEGTNRHIYKHVSLHPSIYIYTTICIYIESRVYTDLHMTLSCMGEGNRELYKFTHL